MTHSCADAEWDRWPRLKIRRGSLRSLSAASRLLEDRGGLNACGHFRDDAFLNVDWPDQGSQSRQFHGEQCGAAHTDCAADQAAEGRYSLDSHRIKAHHAAAFFVLHNSLQNGIARRHLLHETESG